MNGPDKTLERLRGNVQNLRAQWSSRTPFRYLIVDDFLDPEFAQEILSSYAGPDAPGWDGTTYVHQRRKLTRTSGFPLPIQQFFDLTTTVEFRDMMTQITGIPKLLHDPELVGGGLHQILNRGFLDVHVDYNFHPRTKQHRRLNLLVYMNKGWKPEYHGHLELWDMTARRRLDQIAPEFNRAVLFETNEISFHGHPAPLKTPANVTRKSLAIYYYTGDRNDEGAAPEHNTLYRQTTGVEGYMKTLASGAQALAERLRTAGPMALLSNLVEKGARRFRGLPPKNR